MEQPGAVLLRMEKVLEANHVYEEFEAKKHGNARP